MKYNLSFCCVLLTAACGAVDTGAPDWDMSNPDAIAPPEADWASVMAQTAAAPGVLTGPSTMATGVSKVTVLPAAGAQVDGGLDPASYARASYWLDSGPL